jgi:hypothetical protein
MHEFKPKVWMACPLCGKQSPMPDPDRREWVGLTDDAEILAISHTMPYADRFDFARAIEAHLKEKNT